MNNNQTKIIVALILLVLIIAVPSLFIWKFFFSTSDSGLVTVVHPAATPVPVPNVGPSPKSGTVTANGNSLTIQGSNLTLTPAPVARTTAVAPRAKAPRVPGAMPVISDVLPGDLTPGPAAAANGPVTDQMRRDYLKNLWSSPQNRQSDWTRGNDALYRVATGTILPTTVPSDSALAPTLVTVHANGSLTDVLQAVAQQAQVRIASQNQGLFAATTANIQINADQQPLMEVLAEICSQAALVPSTIEPPQLPPSPAAGQSAPPPILPRVIFGQQQPHQTLGPWIVSGSFAYMAEQISNITPVKSGTPGGTSYLQVYIDARAEPKLRMLVGPGNFTVTEAVDDKGLSLLPNGQPVSNAAAWGGQSIDWSQIQERPFNLTCPPGYGHTIVRLRATDHCLVQLSGQTVPFTIPTPDTPVSRTVAGLKVVASVDPQFVTEYGSFTFPVTITYHRDTMPVADWTTLKECLAGARPICFDAANDEMMFWNSQAPQTRQVFVQQPPTLFSRIVAGMVGGTPRGGMMVQNVTGGDDADTFTRTYMYYLQDNRGGRRVPDHFNLEVPTQVAAIDVPVNFDNLPLP